MNFKSDRFIPTRYLHSKDSYFSSRGELGESMNIKTDIVTTSLMKSWHLCMTDHITGLYTNNQKE